MVVDPVTVWIAIEQVWDDAPIEAVAASRESLIAWIKAKYPNLVGWNLEEDGSYLRGSLKNGGGSAWQIEQWEVHP